MSSSNRREFLKSSTVAAAGLSLPYFFTGAKSIADEQKAESANDRPLIGCIGTGSRWDAVGPNAMKLGDVVAVCDVDADHAAKGRQRSEAENKKQGRERKVDVYEDYRKILDRNDIEIVTIVTPDHWHSKIAIEAMKAGKDVYCEKPLTLTIDEGKKICKVAKETGRVFQVGTQQRSEMGQLFLKAIALINEGRIGDIQKIHVAIGGAPTSGPIPIAEVPKQLNWEMWLGQAPLVDYRFKQGPGWGNSRCHYEFRWWYEYSGGKMTDWGAHHVDIAQWGLDQQGVGGPVSLEPIMAKFPTPYQDGMPTQDDRYNTPTEFHVKAMFPRDIEVAIRNECNDLGFDNGVMFEGTKGRFLVNRGKLVGAPVDEMKSNPLPEDAIQKVYKGMTPSGGNAHMVNFFECVKLRKDPISDVYSHHRAMTTCHLANIALRLDRTIKWDEKTEQIVGDEQANGWLSRQARKGYEVTA
ncbi:Gfo/Idh/MocA family oxidoreductase [Blastopirellula sp. JC732]|uniref:Gfo/Idh/MocA family oxidoreductase n=1 Tax=Blastopirellula sediminis TaxID=2894196 RepID=A0A9X1MS65_9BACT|nr:Gfo/Idh/MocA family oxidoreductase [Blastopirellula sediminis]MCC9605300.1 Gfo/Idh/MocA family oxidoreductase [Blastopirellula sediminis]MCC9631400.1 Gfo/Idh/MocA family oxidoreductase [Blastopirellula sediminis]